MTALIDGFPAAPGWHVDWDGLHERFSWARAMAECPQDPIHHAEGDVWTHTRMVCEAMMRSPAWSDADAETRTILFAAALFHDVSKPQCTREENGRITSRGHSIRGEIAARALLWDAGVAPELRERIVTLIRFHQIPFFLVDRPDALRLAYTVSQSARCDRLAVLAEADARGRVCQDAQRLIDNIALFAEFCRENGCLTGPRRFPSDHSRFVYFRRTDRDPDYLAWDDTRSRVVLMAGLPGAGKDSFVCEHLRGWPVISLDDIRRELGVSPVENQGRVIARAREMAKVHLRTGERFVWNATNLSRQIRELCISLFAAYRAHVRIVYVEAPSVELFRRNQNREHPVPAAAIRGLLDRWEIPTLAEAHEVEHHWR